MIETVKPFRPLLADNSDPNIQLARAGQIIKECGFLMASWKLDGIRALVRERHLVSRSLKPIPNHHTRKLLSTAMFEGLDGELICGDPWGRDVMQRCSSAFMSQEGKPELTWWVFDNYRDPSPFHVRYNALRTVVDDFGLTMHHIKLVEQKIVRSLDALAELEEQAQEIGYEGLIVRDPRGPYKQGRSTLREGFMLKIKRFKDSEGEIIGFEELMHNDNQQTKDERGYAKRSTQNAGKRPAGVLGALVVRDIHNPAWTFNIGTGFDHDLRVKIWNDRAFYQGKTAKYKYLPVGTKDAPRHPVYLGLRDSSDM